MSDEARTTSPTKRGRRGALAWTAVGVVALAATGAGTAWMMADRPTQDERVAAITASRNAEYDIEANKLCAIARASIQAGNGANNTVLAYRFDDAREAAVDRMTTAGLCPNEAKALEQSRATRVKQQEVAAATTPPPTAADDDSDYDDGQSDSSYPTYQDELEFAGTIHTCSELRDWYAENPGDSNEAIAAQYELQCGETSPPVLSGELAPFDG